MIDLEAWGVNSLNDLSVSYGGLNLVRVSDGDQTIFVYGTQDPNLVRDNLYALNETMADAWELG